MEMKRGCTVIHFVLLFWAVIISIWIYKIVYDIREWMEERNAEDYYTAFNCSDRVAYTKKNYNRYLIDLNTSIVETKAPEDDILMMRTTDSPVFIKASTKMSQEDCDSDSRILYHFPTGDRALLKSYLYNEFEPFQLFEYYHLQDVKYDFPEWKHQDNLPPWMEKFWDND